MIHRPRILRASASIRKIVQETILQPQNLIAPLFIVEGENIEEEIPSLPGYYRRSLDKTLEEVFVLFNLGIRSILIFIKCPDERKDNEGKEALRAEGLMQTAIRAIRKHIPEMIIMTDIALDPYSMYGHDGIVKDQEIDNDTTIKILAKMAVSHAQAGAHFVAPSDMMDGRIAALRQSLENAGFHNTGIMSYSAKYASCFYGPFRDALDSAPGFGDKKTYQMDPANRKEAIKEVLLDVHEGADIVMVKPALSYLDIIREVKNATNIPVSAYHVSGEYAMIKAAAQKGWLNEDQAIMETTLSIKRAGADLIASYFSKDIIRILNNL
ncbi:porphobilinogen synthase [Sediminibacterium sp. C3]|uniref:porphobilinogen synthase n=1 Tax=Sediminibacterium sp. C3 TaxID=1267211 RepID=UPI000417F619|nr:porphobilinogen synthase [Sediminibacterium sp. C3]